MENTAQNQGNPDKKKSRSQFPVAVAYFITLLVCLGIFGLLGKYIVEKFVNIGDDTVLSSEDMGIPTEEDRFTVLYVQVDNDGVMQHGLVVRFLPDICEIKLVPVSAYTMASPKKGDSQDTLKNIYASSGVNAVKNAVENMIGADIDKYMTVSNASFDNVVDYIGGVSVVPDEDIYYNNAETGERIYGTKNVAMTLSNTFMRLYINYQDFSDGPEENLRVLNDVMPRFINEMFLQATNLTNNMDTFFNVIYNNSDTNMTKNEYLKSKKSIVYIINNGNMPAASLIPQGTWSDGVFYADVNFSDKVEEFFNAG